ncbi:MAG: Gfo/Idh/MocA family oxidoreductase [Sphingomonadales bacterium]|nr:Gfo/Idh/MocA family oxidoreductase [Sphingomonadales bacterium]
MSQRRLKAIGIGAGYFSAFHYDAWTRLSDRVEMAAILALDTGQAQQMAQTYAIAEAHNIDALEEVIARIRPDIVDIIAPPPAHKQLVEICAKHKMAILCQKPLGRDFAEAEKIVQIAKDASVPFMVHENWRWQPWYREMAKWAGDTQPLGKTYSIVSTMRMGDGWADNAYLERQPYFRNYPRLLIFETGVHFLDTFRFLGGEISSVYSRIQKRNAAIAGEDAAQIICGFTNGATAILDASRYNESEHPNPRFTFGTMRIDCANGHVRLDEDGRLWVKQLGHDVSEIDYIPPKTGFAGDCAFATLNHFVTELNDARNFETDGPSYLKTLKLVDACYRSAAENKVVIL